MRAIDELRASRGDDVAVEFSNIMTKHLGNTQAGFTNPSVAPALTKQETTVKPANKKNAKEDDADNSID